MATKFPMQMRALLAHLLPQDVGQPFLLFAGQYLLKAQLLFAHLAKESNHGCQMEIKSSPIQWAVQVFN
jgi:hypothetical protein